MPPARDTVYPYHVIEETASKSPWNGHVVNIQDLLTAEKNKDDKSHLVLTINEFSPELITIERSGNTLTVETESEDRMGDGEGGVEHTVQNYEIPQKGYTKEFGAQLAADGILSVRGPDNVKMSGRIIPIQLSQLSQLKPGTIVHLDTTINWSGEGQNKGQHNVNVCLADVKMEEGDAAELDEESNKLPAGANAAQSMEDAVKNLEDIIRDIRLDDAV